MKHNWVNPDIECDTRLTVVRKIGKFYGFYCTKCNVAIPKLVGQRHNISVKDTQ